MQHDSEFDMTSIPLSQWLETGEIEEISWRVDIKDSGLRLDQRLELPYSVTVQAKTLNKLGGSHELYFISGLDGPEGKPLAAPKVVHYSVKSDLPDELEIRFSDSFFAKPGDYSLWLALYDRETEKHSLEKRRVQVSEVENDPLPRVAEHLPTAEFPDLSDLEGGSVLEFYDGLSLPVSNKRPLRVELIPVMSAPEQWVGRQSIIRSHNEATVATLNALSQLRLADGSMSVTGLDVLHRKTPFEQKDLSRMDWPGLADAFKKIDNNTVSAAALLAKGGGPFFRDFVNAQLAGPAEPLRVLVVVSSSLVFGRGADRDPIKLQGDCSCRVYHLRFRHTLNDAFDDLERLIRPLRPKTYNIAAPRDLRKALAEIIRDLENL